MRGQRNLYQPGEKYGKLTIIERWTDCYGKKKEKESICKCLCECGKTITIPTRYLKVSPVRSCGCSQRLTNKNHPSWSGYEEISGDFWHKIEKSANRRGRIIPFDITIQDVWSLFLKQGRKCAISGVSIEFPFRNCKYGFYGTASLDRIDSEKGYTLDNVWWTHKIVNSMKSYFPLDEFLFMCEAVYNYNIGIIPESLNKPVNIEHKNTVITNLNPDRYIATRTNLQVGEKRNKLTVLDIWSEIRNNKKIVMVHCKCDCGNFVTTVGHMFKIDHKKSCGCIQNPGHSKHPSWKGYGEISGLLWNNIRECAVRRNRIIPFCITIEQGWNLFLKQNRRCALTGIEIDFHKRSKNKSHATASLDRIDSSLGYTIDNIQWVHKTINLMKWDYPQTEFINWCCIIDAYQKSMAKC